MDICNCDAFFISNSIMEWRSASNRIVYSDFQQKWINDEIDSIVVEKEKMSVSGKTRDNKQFTTYAPSELIQQLIIENPKDDVKVEFNQPSNSSFWISLIPTLMLMVLLFIFFYMMTQQSQGGGREEAL